MGNIISYLHYGKYVYVDEDLKGRHRAHCLCFRCAKFHPDTPINCDFAEQNYRTCKINGMAMPVWECPEFEQKISNQRL